MIANVARYHRGAEPKRKHDNYRQLSGRDQRRVSQLAAILRLAGGLDRSNTQQVQALTVVQKGGTTRIGVLAPLDPEVDLWGARRRTGLFNRVFDTKVELFWQPQATTAELLCHENGSPLGNGHHEVPTAAASQGEVV